MQLSLLEAQESTAGPQPGLVVGSTAASVVLAFEPCFASGSSRSRRSSNSVHQIPNSGSLLLGLGCEGLFKDSTIRRRVRSAMAALSPVSVCSGALGGGLMGSRPPPGAKGIGGAAGGAR